MIDQRSVQFEVGFYNFALYSNNFIKRFSPREDVLYNTIQSVILSLSIDVLHIISNFDNSLIDRQFDDDDF